MADPLVPSRDSDEPPAVADDELLWRLLRPDWIVPEEKNGGRPRVSSVAYKDRTNPECAVSVFRRALMPDELRADLGRKYSKAAQLSASMPRGLGHIVRPDTEGDQHRSHAVVVPVHREDKRWEKDASKLARASVIVDIYQDGPTDLGQNEADAT